MITKYYIPFVLTPLKHKSSINYTLAFIDFSRISYFLFIVYKQNNFCKYYYHFDNFKTR